MSVTLDTITSFFQPRVFWENFSLSQKFAIAGGFVILCGLTISGIWVTHLIEDGVTKNAAVSTAFYVDGSIAPLASHISSSGKLSDDDIEALDDVLEKSPIGQNLVSTKIWTKEGIVAYSSNHAQIGEKFDVTSELLSAFDGNVIANFDDLHDEEDQVERDLNLPLLEIYSPIRVPRSGIVVAVAEFYQNGEQLQKSIDQARTKSWFFVAAIMSVMAGLLMVIVHGGSRTINEQRKSLRNRLAQVTHVAHQNKLLHERIQTSSNRVTELNEQYLKRISADLHDGPAQLLALAALKIDGIDKTTSKLGLSSEIRNVKEILSHAMQDVRQISRGLTLPEIKELTLRQTIERVVKKHVQRTKIPVKLSSPSQNYKTSYPIKICVFRFVQEGLTNAWKHAGGVGQAVTWKYDQESKSLILMVSDHGPGFPEHYYQNASSGLGVEGMRERIQSIGGTLAVRSRPGGGTIIEMKVGLMEAA